ncbi:MAG: transcription-repair coupling factor, partial [Parvularculaceae bacterium]|nr:transcription-repair coupling factor [Parvularculaceae bacterium]
MPETAFALSVFGGCMTVVSGVREIGSDEAWRKAGPLDVYGAPDGADALAVAAAASARSGVVVHVARDAARASALCEAVRFFAPGAAVVEYPAWDCLPYDRVSPSAAVVSARMAMLALLAGHDGTTPLVVSTTVNAILQRTPPREAIVKAAFAARAGQSISVDGLNAYLAANGYARASTVREPGEFAVRGGLIDIFPPGADEPVRLDLFGDQLETVRAFDPATQMTTRPLTDVRLSAATEVLLTDDTRARFRLGFRAAFGAVSDDPVYEAVSAGRKHAGMEHWLPLYYERLDALFDFIRNAAVFLDWQADEVVSARLASIADYFAARNEDQGDKRPRSSEFSAPAYRPLPPERLYLTAEDWSAALGAVDLRRLSPFAPPEGRRTFDFGAKIGRNFAAERAAEKVNVFDAARAHVEALRAAGKRAYVACWTEGSAERMATVLSDHGLGDVPRHRLWSDALEQKEKIGALVLGLDQGFETK